MNTTDIAAEAWRKLTVAHTGVLSDDTKRLDWLSRYCYLPADHPSDKIAVLIPESISPMGSFTCNDDNDKVVFRKAIDAAMKEQK